MIRKATKDDASRVAEIHVFGWRAAYGDIVAEGYLFGRLSVARRAAALAEQLGTGEETYVYEEAGIPGRPGDEPGAVIRGWMTIGDSRDDDIRGGPDGDGAFELWAVYVDPLMKRRGVGKALVAFCEAEARARGRDSVSLWVFRDNAPARAFYQALGYRPDGAEQLIEGLGAREVRYRKRL